MIVALHSLRADRRPPLESSLAPRVGFWGGAGCAYGIGSHPAPPHKLQADARTARATTSDAREARFPDSRAHSLGGASGAETGNVVARTAPVYLKTSWSWSWSWSRSV